MHDAAPHHPVMLQEVLATLQPQAGEKHVDATFGAGGYSRAILAQADCQLYGIDRDPDVQHYAEELQAKAQGRFALLTGCFSQMQHLLEAQQVHQVDGIVMDLGVSSMQLDQAERGFSFQKDGPLDMRQSQQGMSAADAVNTLSEKELADILYRYGEERKSRQIARAILQRRAETPFTTTADLAELVRTQVRQHPKIQTDPATRTFQALRIYVNQELEELEAALEASIALLKDGGRLVVVSFHSLEDRIVKQFLRKHSQLQAGGSRHLPQEAPKNPMLFEVPQRKAMLPTEEEMMRNPRARSARLRYAVRKRGDSGR
jgi:16S rRNA (cytosine1402-N4)-methyltransferase